MQKSEYPKGWYSQIARVVAVAYDVTDEYVRKVARGKRENPDILESVQMFCNSHLENQAILKKN